jgi:hypothetical protein
MAVELSVEVSVVCVVVVDEGLASGAVDCELGMVDDGELAPGVIGCWFGVDCATAQAAESMKIAVVKRVFFISNILLDFSACWLGRETE